MTLHRNPFNLAPGADYLFSWLVEYHATRNVQESLPYIREGRIHTASGTPLTEGSDKYAPHDGLVIFRNGSTLLDRLVADGRVNPRDIDAFKSVRMKDQFFDFLATRGEEDGAYVYEATLGQIARVCQIYPKNLGSVLEASVPPDFVYSGNTVCDDLHLRLGTKTRLAIEVPRSYDDVHAYQIKRSAFGELGMGKVTHFGPQGLQEEYFLKVDPTSQGPFVNEEHRIVGVHRQYGEGVDAGVKHRRVAAVGAEPVGLV